MFTHPFALGAAVFAALVALAPETANSWQRLGRAFWILAAAAAAVVAVD